MGTFLEIATPLIQRGIPVIPVRPQSKRGVHEDQFEVATTDINVVRAWNDENSAYNVGCVGTPEGIVILDADNPELIARIERDTGHKMPRTFTVRSGGKKLPHLYLRQSEMSRAIGNKKASGSFDLPPVAPTRHQSWVSNR
jgi:Bifunctional DNA primase/polymerase, N-terminal